jgi:hypothetical protein
MNEHAEGGDLTDPSDSNDFPVCPAEPPTVGAACTLPPIPGCAYPVREATSVWTCAGFVCDRTGHWKKAPGC